eukprot:2214748-Pyramimonas_sp.AAC.1
MVPARVESAILKPAFLFCSARAQWKLNSMQAAWARRLLGCACGPPIPSEVVLAQRDWRLRLGAKMMERIVVAFARAQLQQEGRPARAMLALADGLTASTWARSVCSHMAAFSPPIPRVTECQFFGACPLDAVRADPGVRRAVLRHYTLRFVRPAMVAAGLAAVQQAASA